MDFAGDFDGFFLPRSDAARWRAMASRRFPAPRPSRAGWVEFTLPVSAGAGVLGGALMVGFGWR